MIDIQRIPTPTDNSLESLQAYVAQCASVVFNREPKNHEKLWKRLMTEAYGGKPSRVLEYIPCAIEHGSPIVAAIEIQPEQFFGFTDDSKYYTNMRELLNWGLSVEEILPLVDYSNYVAVKITCPYFIYGQVSTHNQLTSVSHSNRYSDANLGYWLPDEVRLYLECNYKTDLDEYLYELQTEDFITNDVDELWNYMVLNLSPLKLQAFMKKANVVRREVWARGVDMLQTRVGTLGGYTSNPNAWPWFIKQRLLDPHTQLETRQLTEKIEEVLNDNSINN